MNYSLAHLLKPPTYPITHSNTHARTHALAHSLNRSLTRPPTHRPHSFSLILCVDFLSKVFSWDPTQSSSTCRHTYPTQCGPFIACPCVDYQDAPNAWCSFGIPVTDGYAEVRREFVRGRGRFVLAPKAVILLSEFYFLSHFNHIITSTAVVWLYGFPVI